MLTLKVVFIGKTPYDEQIIKNFNGRMNVLGGFFPHTPDRKLRPNPSVYALKRVENKIEKGMIKR